MMAKAAGVPDAWEAAGLNTGLLHYWAMRTSGTTVYDEYGSKNGTAVNTPTFSTANGVRDDGAGLNGTDELITVASFSDVITGNKLTFASWVKAASWRGGTGSSSRNCVFQCVDSLGSPAGAFFVTFGDQGMPFFLYHDGSYRVTSSSTQYSTGEWIHVAATRDGASTAIYINGIIEAQNTLTTNSFSATSTADIGRQTEALGRHFHGAIDELAIWSRALSSNEVYQVYSTPLYAPYK
jgi:hypothetical protein